MIQRRGIFIKHPLLIAFFIVTYIASCIRFLTEHLFLIPFLAEWKKEYIRLFIGLRFFRARFPRIIARLLGFLNAIFESFLLPSTNVFYSLSWIRIFQTNASLTSLEQFYKVFLQVFRTSDCRLGI